MPKSKNQTGKTKQLWRFYRSNLSTIVWDATKGKALADFSEGHFTTDNESTAKLLKEKGYIQIPLDATEPPDIVISQPTQTIEGDVPVIKVLTNSKIKPSGVEETKAEKTMEQKTKTVGGPPPLKKTGLPKRR